MQKYGRVSPTLVVALIALFVALSGTAYAAVTLPRNSVTTIQVKDRSLLSKDFKAGQLPAGPAGANGATNVVVREASATLSPGGLAGVRALCQGSERVTGGGYNYNTGAAAVVLASFPVMAGTVNAWHVTAENRGSSPTVLVVFAICAAP